jgi:hypothetical protein
VVVVVAWVVGGGGLLVVEGRVVVVVGRLVVEGRVVEVELVVDGAGRRLSPQSDWHAESAMAADRATPIAIERANLAVSLDMARFSPSRDHFPSGTAPGESRAGGNDVRPGRAA